MARRRLVQKYGGTSLGSAERLHRVAEIVRTTQDAGDDVCVVLSAISESSKSVGTTSRLLAAAELVVAKESTREGYQRIVEEIRDTHLAIVRAALSDDTQYARVEAELRHECAQLTVFLEAAQVIGEMSTRSLDAVIGVGEKLACRVFVAVLRSLGVKAVMVNLCKVIERVHDEKHLNADFYAYLRTAIVQRVQETRDASGGDHIIPVVTGYFGFIAGGIVQSIGRGYSDFTASLLAAGLAAHELQIWKQVDGIFTADPSRVPAARLLQHISPAEAVELTYYGAEVIHPFTMAQAIQASIPIRIKNTYKPNDNGTVILPDILSGQQSPPVKGHEDAHVKRAKLDPLHDQVATAVTVKGPVWVVNLKSNRKALAHGFLEDTFAALNRHSVVVDVIATSEVTLSMAITPSNERGLLLAVEELREIGTVSVQRDMAIVSLVGRHMKHVIGIAAKMFAALAEEAVNIEMISQGASEINISCVIAHRYASAALNAIHRRLIEGLQEPTPPLHS